MIVVVVVVVVVTLPVSVRMARVSMSGRGGWRDECGCRDVGGVTATSPAGRGRRLGRGGAVIVFLMCHGVDWIVCSRSKVKRLC